MTRPEIKAHTGLRGLAALNVMCGHIGLDHWFPYLRGTQNYLLFGNQAVDLFFVLSGFILAYSYHPKDECEQADFSWGNFFVARLARIYPLHLATLIIMGLMAWQAGRHGLISAEYRSQDFVIQLLLLSSLPVIGVARPWNYPSWSISTEWICYLCCFPVSFYARRKLTAKIALIGVLALTAIAVSWLVQVPAGENLGMGVTALLRGICGFFAGSLLHHLSIHAPHLRALAARSLPWLFLAVMLLSIASRAGLVSAWLMLILWPPLVLGTTERGSFVTAALSHPAALFLGELSYSLYMLHAVFGRMANATLFHGSPWSPAVSTIAGVLFIIAIFAASMLSYRFLERPARDWIRSKFGRRMRKDTPDSGLTH